MKLVVFLLLASLAIGVHFLGFETQAALATGIIDPKYKKSRDITWNATKQELLTASGFYEPEFRRDHTVVNETFSNDCLFKILKSPKNSRVGNLTNQQTAQYNLVNPSPTHDVIVVRTNGQEYSACKGKGGG